MPANTHQDELTASVRQTLESTQALARCPFHYDVLIRIGNDAAETHAYIRAKNAGRGEGKLWKPEALTLEFERQLGQAADHHCPHCASTAPA